MFCPLTALLPSEFSECMYFIRCQNRVNHQCDQIISHPHTHIFTLKKSTMLTLYSPAVMKQSNPATLAGCGVVQWRQDQILIGFTVVDTDPFKYALIGPRHPQLWLVFSFWFCLCETGTRYILDDGVCAAAERMWEAYDLPWSSPAGLLIKVVPYPGVGLDSHQARHVHLLDVMSGGQHYLIGVSLDMEGSAGEWDEEGRKDNIKGGLGNSLR